MSTETGPRPAGRVTGVPMQRHPSPVRQPPAGARRAGTGPTLPRRARWQSRYARKVAASDLLAVAVSVALYRVWGTASTELVLGMGAAVIALVALCLVIVGAWEPAVLGQESVEFTRLLRGTMGAAVIVGLASLALQLPAGRPWAFGVLPLGGALAAAGRLLLRHDLYRRRKRGTAMARVLAVGKVEAVHAFITRTKRAPRQGWSVVGVCTPTGTGRDGAPSVAGIPVLGDLDAAPLLARSALFDAVSVTASPGWSPRRLQQLAWDLEGTGTELIVDPGLMEVAGPRLHVATVDGLPLLRLTHPTFTGAPRLLKGAFDRIAALIGLVLLAPLMLGIAVAVRRDGGPVLFWQKRVGLGGREFRMAKFRSMVVDAEQQLPALQAANEAAGPLFKLRRDPRITRIGAVLRKYSLDELPQLFNVITGSMSLVGPRPPLPREVSGYEQAARRKLLVKPGMTGLWQVSGRSDLSWEETVRLDLRYVENWTLALDAQILIRTVRTVVSGGGAY